MCNLKHGIKDNALKQNILQVHCMLQPFAPYHSTLLKRGTILLSKKLKDTFLGAYIFYARFKKLNLMVIDVDVNIMS
jgi:hypothetical protein